MLQSVGCDKGTSHLKKQKNLGQSPNRGGGGHNAAASIHQANFFFLITGVRGEAIAPVVRPSSGQCGGILYSTLRSVKCSQSIFGFLHQ